MSLHVFLRKTKEIKYLEGGRMWGGGKRERKSEISRNAQSDIFSNLETEMDEVIRVILSQTVCMDIVKFSKRKGKIEGVE